MFELEDTVDDMPFEHSAVGVRHAEVHPWYAVDAPRKRVAPTACGATTNAFPIVGVNHLIRKLFCAAPEKNWFRFA